MIIFNQAREVVGSGSHTLVLTQDQNKVLLVTTPKQGKRIKAVLARLVTDENIPLLLPHSVGDNLSLCKLIAPKRPRSAKKRVELKADTLWTYIHKKNCVFEMERFAGSLEDFRAKSFSSQTITCIEQSIKKLLGTLHSKGVTHGDIDLRNVLYKGTYPNFQFALTDLSSAQCYNLDDPKQRATFEINRKADNIQLEQMITKLKDIRKHLPKTPNDCKKPPPAMFSRSGRLLKPDPTVKRLDFSHVQMKVRRSARIRKSAGAAKI